jgi:hypothetical protein
MVYFTSSGQELWRKSDVPVPHTGEVVKFPDQSGEYTVESVGYDYLNNSAIVTVVYRHGNPMFPPS